MKMYLSYKIELNVSLSFLLFPTLLAAMGIHESPFLFCSCGFCLFLEIKWAECSLTA